MLNDSPRTDLDLAVNQRHTLIISNPGFQAAPADFHQQIVPSSGVVLVVLPGRLAQTPIQFWDQHR